MKDKLELVWNLDETNLCIIPTRVKVVGKRNLLCSKTTSGWCQENTTVLFTCNAKEEKVPPLNFFKGINLWDAWLANACCEYPGTNFASNKKNWMYTKIFNRYLKKSLLPYITAQKTKPALLIYDGQTSQVPVDVIETANEYNVNNHTKSTTTSQPLDVSGFQVYEINLGD